MKYLIPAFFLSVFFFNHHALAENEPLTVCTHLGFEPYVIHDNKGLSGIDIDIVKTIIQNENLNAKIITVPWLRLLSNLKNGGCDIGFSLFDHESRRHFVDYIFNVPLHVSTHKVFVKKGSEFPFEKVADLFGLRVGHNRGFTLSQALELGIETRSIQHVEYDNPQNALRMLHAGRIHAILDNELRIQYYLKKLNLEDTVTALDIPFLPHKPAFLTLSKKAKVKQPKLFKAHLYKQLEILEKNGTIERIYAKYK